MDHPIRNGIADTIANLFSVALDPIASLPSTISGIISVASNGSGNDPVTGAALGSVASNITETAKAIGTGLQPVGYALCFLFFMISLIELAMSERMTMEYFVKFFSKLVIGFAAVYYWEKIYDICKEFGPGLMDIIVESSEDATTMSDLGPGFREFCANNGASTWLILVLVGGIVGFLMIAASFILIGVVYIIVFTWLIEVSLRGAFLPVACALLSDDGWRGAGGRYIRKFLGVCCQGAAMSAVASLMSGGMVALFELLGTQAQDTSILSSDFWGFMGTFLRIIVVTLALGIATVSAMFKTSAIVSDVFGG